MLLPKYQKILRINDIGNTTEVHVYFNKKVKMYMYWNKAAIKQ